MVNKMIWKTSNPKPNEIRVTKDTGVWDDIQVALSSAKLPPSSAPTWRTYDFGVGSGVAYGVLGFAVGDYIDLYIQTSHSMLLNSVLDLHLHYTVPSDDSGKKIQFQLDVVASGIGVDFAVPSGSPYTAEITLDGAEAGKHNLMEVAEIAAVNSTVSSVYVCRLTRIAASSVEYGNEVYIS